MFTFFYSSNTISGTCALLEAGEGISAYDVCYIKASDKKAYQLDSSMTSELAQITVMALETLTTGDIGRFMVNGVVTNAGWSFTAGQVIIVPASKGTPTAESDV